MTRCHWWGFKKNWNNGRCALLTLKDFSHTYLACLFSLQNWGDFDPVGQCLTHPPHRLKPVKQSLKPVKWCRLRPCRSSVTSEKITLTKSSGLPQLGLIFYQTKLYCWRCSLSLRGGQMKNMTEYHLEPLSNLEGKVIILWPLLIWVCLLWSCWSSSKSPQQITHFINTEKLWKYYIWFV